MSNRIKDRVFAHEIQSIDQVNDATVEFNMILNHLRTHCRGVQGVRVTIEPVSAAEARVDGEDAQ